ncbi:di-heme oxidoredictase family protein [Sediminibacterium sp.]|uniref:di-heme oxidoredictase family protein n=1 Tax=Sediminibacterium sp. TaxID=1917865 RepID=UPI00273420D2|nr:di-heme oxidoredictase family protein [Sediminibacterium sp.]MDP3393321.1 di-heme oxidoredictase family protein [Sediminibacterium sp.]MDP3567923.1 di-heme oxidoredictase family protein [Sediminibacterium sp.]
MKKFKIITAIVLVITTVVACEKILPGTPPDDELLDGPVEGLSFEQNRQFLAGDVAFNDEIFTSQNGLGSIFVATSCGSCHAGDGKGHPFTTLTRFGQTDSTGNQFLHLGGPQLQSRALPGYSPEQIPAGATFSKFTPPANTGLGFLELVSDADILAMTDPNDINGDGISGVPNWITLPSFITPNSNAITQNGKYIHRFGKKAAAHNLLHQTVNAYNQDIGITSTFHPQDVYSGLNIDPEVSDQTVHSVVFYLQTLKAPIQRNQNDAEVIQGKNIFIQTGCESCHKQTLKTGFSSIAPLANKLFHPYTDLLLHDMGPGLDDNYTEGNAKTSEWRTPPLWGLGLSPNSQGGQYFLLHDGRAKSIEEAIQFHGGEAQQSKERFQQLSVQDKNNLIKFLKSL